jgi:hypothetical protein
MDGRRRGGRVQLTLPSTLLCIAGGTSCALDVPLSTDRAPVKESTGTSQQTATRSSLPADWSAIGAAAAAAAATSSAAAASSETCEGRGEKEGGDEAMEVEEQLGDSEAHCDSHICTSPSSSSTGTLASSSSLSMDSEGSTTAVLNPMQHAVSEGHAIGTGSLDKGGTIDS